MALVQTLLAEYPSLAVRDVLPLGQHGGFSGARLFRLRCEQGDFALKLWPSDRDAAKIARIDALVDEACSKGLTFVPRLARHRGGGLLVCRQGRCADVATWQPGTADFRLHPTPGRLRNACEALARLHLTWQPSTVRVGPCPGIERRLESLQAWSALDRTGPASLLSGHPLALCIEPARRLARRWLRPAQELLRPWRDVALPVQPCLCDVWHDHVLFSDDQVTGLVDYGSVKLDHVGVDLARMLGSFLGDDPARREEGLDAYHRLKALTIPERDLVAVLDRTGVIAALCNWLRWIEEGRQWPDLGAVAERLDLLIQRVEKWTLLRDS